MIAVDTGPSQHPASIAVFPPYGDGNPYFALLHEQLRLRGVHATAPGALTPRWAASTTVDAAHVHWVEFLARSTRGHRFRWLFSAARIARMAVALAVLRVRGRAVVWTVHNFAAHEPVHPRLERLAARVLTVAATAIAVHSEWAAERVRRVVGRRAGRRVHVVPHGNYLGAYPLPARTRSQARSARDIGEDAFVYLAFGQARAYKRLPELVAAFRSVAAADDRLVLAGEPRGDGVREAIVDAIDDDSRILTEFAFVPDDEVAEWYEVADAAVLAYSEIFSSGALLLALSFDTPVVAPAVGSTVEIAPGGSSALFQPGGLGAALIAVRSDPVARRAAAHDAARAADWGRSADTLTRLYGRTGRGRSRRTPASRTGG